MDDLLPADPRRRTLALAIWAVLTIVGTIAVWWLTTYLDTLTELAATDRGGAIELFRSHVLPILMLVVLVAVVSGALLLRQGVRMLREAQIGVEGARGVRDTPGAARLTGGLMAGAGFLLAAVPLVLLSVVLWMLRQA